MRDFDKRYPNARSSSGKASWHHVIAGGYLAWLVIPLVVGSDLSPRVKTALTAFLGATPLLTKLIAIALLGRPTINFLKKHSFKLFRRAGAAD
jgi:hypothetical protein